MPILHEYTDGSGFYIRSTVDGQYVTFQVYESAGTLLSNIGYKDGEELFWELLEPLWEHGFVYTGNRETTTQVETHLDDRDLPGLDEDKRTQVKEFFDEQYRQSITVPDDIYATLRKWHNDKYSIEWARDLYYQANDEGQWETSVRAFRESPLEISGIEASEGDPAYHVSVRDRHLRCVDVRHTRKPLDLIITLRGASGWSQGLFINCGALTQWKIYAPSNTRGPTQWRELIDRLPGIAELCSAIPDYNCNLYAWDFHEASTQAIPDDIADCLQLDWIRVVESLGKANKSSPHYRGKVESMTVIDHGVISTDKLRENLVFRLDGGEIEPGEDVKFRIERMDGRTRATDVHVPNPKRIKSSPTDSSKYRTS